MTSNMVEETAALGGGDLRGGGSTKSCQRILMSSESD